jgi:predicted amidohydrolase YtcJ
MPNTDTRSANPPRPRAVRRRMLARRTGPGVLALTAVLAANAAQAAALLLTNGNFYTGSDRQPHAQAIVIVDGRIRFVGGDTDALHRAPAGAERLDLHGATVVPGLTDAHAHPAAIGLRELTFNLEGTDSLSDLQKRLREQASRGNPGEWLFGRGWIESKWTPATFPTRADLDAVAANRPIVLQRADGHALVANSLALRLAGVDRNTPDPPGGRILRDAGSGEPTGMLIDNAQDMVEHRLPPPDDT